MKQFPRVLAEHLSRYPALAPQDLMKLCFQSEFGPAHLVPETSAPARYILEEWQSLPPDRPATPPEELGNGLVRFHFTNEYPPEEAAPLLARLFSITAKDHQGTEEGLLQRLSMAEAAFLSARPDWEPDAVRAAFAHYRARGCPAVHHSDGFRAAYSPHYRLLFRDMALYFPLLLELEKMAGGILALDGLCGSGKTRLAGLLERVFGCSVIHTDDFYLPLDRREENWQDVPAGNMDLERLESQVLRPLSQGKTASFRPWSCQTGTFGAEKTCTPRKFTVLEGSYSHHPSLRGYFDRMVFLTCTPETQLARLRAREGDYASRFEALWIPMEQRYHKAFPKDGNTTIIDTTHYF